jgi:chemotaxis protein MotB
MEEFMKTNGLVFTLVALIIAPALLTGCGPDAKDKRIADLQKENDHLNDRDSQMGQLTGRDEDAQRSVRDLNREIADLRDRLAKAQADLAAKPAVSGNTQIVEGGAEGKWIGMPGFDMIRINSEVLFDSGKATLRPAGKTTLDKIASDIRARYSDRDIYVFGYTDDEPIKKSGWKDNWQLGAERSLTTTRYLIQAGLSPQKIIQANCGEYHPRVPNSNLANRKQNRRVEFFAVEKRNAIGTENLGSAATSGAALARSAN